MTRIRVLAFARYAELLGGTVVEVEVDEPMTVASIANALRVLPGGELLPGDLVVAVNHRQADATQPIAAGDEVAVLPPVAGG